MDNFTVEDLLMREEGYRESPYYCSEGYPTIGIGTRIGPKGAPLKQYQIKFSKAVAKLFLSEEIEKIRSSLSGYSWFQSCNTARQAVLISMAYQMGVSGLLQFKNTLRYITDGDYASAGSNMRLSKWYSQTKARAERHIQVMISGNFDAYKD